MGAQITIEVSYGNATAPSEYHTATAPSEQADWCKTGWREPQKKRVQLRRKNALGKMES